MPDLVQPGHVDGQAAAVGDLAGEGFDRGELRRIADVVRDRVRRQLGDVHKHERAAEGVEDQRLGEFDQVANESKLGGAQGNRPFVGRDADEAVHDDRVGYASELAYELILRRRALVVDLYRG